MPLSRARLRLLRRITTRRGREAEGAVLVEGPRTVEAALAHGARFRFVVRGEGAPGEGVGGLMQRLDAEGIEVVEASDRQVAGLAATESPQGVLAVVRRPASALPAPRAGTALRCLILDAVQDPGNAGGLVRTGAALGVDLVLSLDGTVDPWNPKAIRASAGLVFRLPPHPLEWPAAREWLAEGGLPLLVARAGGRDVRAWLRSGEAPGASGWALALGNEGAGPRPGVLESARAHLGVPLPPGVESLNVAVAGAILLWALGPGREPAGEPAP